MTLDQHRQAIIAAVDALLRECVPCDLDLLARAEAAEAEAERLSVHLAIAHDEWEASGAEGDRRAHAYNLVEYRDEAREQRARAESAEAVMASIRVLIDEIGDGASERTLAEWLEDVRALLDSTTGRVVTVARQTSDGPHRGAQTDRNQP